MKKMHLTFASLPLSGRGHQSFASTTLQRPHPHIPISSSSGAAKSKEKHRMTSDAPNPIANLFNVQLKDEANDVISEHFFANGITFLVACSPYYKEVVDTTMALIKAQFLESSTSLTSLHNNVTHTFS